MPSHRRSKTRSKNDSKAELTTFARHGEGSDLQNVTQNSIDPPEDWPVNISYSALPAVSPWLNEKQRKWLHQKPAAVSEDTSLATEGPQDTLPLIRLPMSQNDVDARIQVRCINQDDHPACGQFGLFASRKLSPGELIIPYIGYIHSSTASEQSQFKSDSEQDNKENIESNEPDQILTPQFAIGSWDTSDYDLNMIRDEDMELAVDAAQLGNEARFCNDYRGVPLAASASNQQTRSAFDRKSKRTAKTWNEHESQQPESQANYTRTTSIPNAEFRDVWFEWSVDVDGSNLTDLGQGLAALQISKDTENTQVSPCENIQKVKSTPARKRKVGMRGVAIFVLPAGKSGKRKHGIPEGHEILVSYGKGFWAHH